MTDQMEDVNDHGSLPWGSNDLTSEKPVLHYITHTCSCRKQSRFEGVRTEHVQTDEIPAGCGEIALASHRARWRGNHHPFPRIPPVPLLRSGAVQPRKVAPG